MRATNPPDFRLSESRINPFHDIFRSARLVRAGVFRTRVIGFENHGWRICHNLIVNFPRASWR
jgi:hypothetical protein